jgi:methionine-rich copper-binding protein CopC
MKRILAAAATAALTFGLFGATALAHAEFQGSTPAPGSTVTAAPAAVTITYTEDLASGSTGFVSNAGRLTVSTGATISTTTRNQLTIGLKPGLPSGTYTVFWHSVSADDGDQLDGSFSFNVSIPAAAAPAAPAAPGPITRAPNTATQPDTDPRDIALGLLTLAATLAFVSIRALRQRKA